MSILSLITGNARALDRATLHAYVVSVYAEDAAGACEMYRAVVERPMHMAPLGEDIVPDGCVVRWCEVLPASRFEDMTASQREKSRGQYAAYLRWRKAKAIGKAIGEMTPWVDFDVLMEQSRIARWIRDGV